MVNKRCVDEATQKAAATHTGHVITFFVAGRPEPRGSKKAFPFKRKNGKLGVSVSDDNPKSRDWMATICQAAAAVMDGKPLLAGPVRLRLTFVMPRPQGHFGSGRNSDKLKATAPTFHTKKPDRLKLARGVEDALTQIIYADDAQIVGGSIDKLYGDRPGVQIELTPTGSEL